MNNDESLDNGTGNIGNAGNRNYSPQKYPEKMPNYSPSTSYNYGHHGGYGGMQQHPRRRADRFKRESLNLNDKVVKQNDLIIRLLKEIRDRLPLPPNQEQQLPQAAENIAPVQDAAQDVSQDTSQDAAEDAPESQTFGEEDGQTTEFSA
jgi:hypothetical protein